MTEIVLSAVLSSLAVAAAALTLHRRKTNALLANLETQSARANEAERQVHLREMEFLADKNKAELAHLEALSQARSAAFEEGRKHGKTEEELETAKRLADQQGEFVIRLQAEKEQAAMEARERQRAEQELQTKLFSVKISPYVKLSTEEGFFKKTRTAAIGYQYQLLVNGIPAFQPHVIVQRSETHKAVDESVKDTLLSLAQDFAEGAITTYLGGSQQFASLAPSVLEEA